MSGASRNLSGGGGGSGDSSGTWNHFRTKREAHKFGRSGGGRFNPFSRTFETGSHARAGPRAGSWAHGDVEAQQTEPDRNELAYIHTEPTYSSSYNQPSPDGTSGINVPEAPELGSMEAAAARDAQAPAHKPAPNGTLMSKDSTTGSATEQRDHTARSRFAPKEAIPRANSDDEKQIKKPKKEHRLFKNVQPKQPFTVANQIHRTILGSWINLLLLAAPAGIALGFIPHTNGIVLFVVNFVAIIPLAAMLSFATEEIALRTGETLGGLLNATFGNAVELIVAIIALVKGETVIVQTSLIGSILSNLLLVMGMCFFFGGLNRREQYFNMTVAQTAASLLALAVAGVIVPTVFDHNSHTSQEDVASLSRGTSVLLLVVYGGYLYFQLKTHHEVFSEESQKAPTKPSKNALKPGSIAQGLVAPGGIMTSQAVRGGHDFSEETRDRLITPPKDDEGDEAEAEEPQLSFLVALGTLAGSTVIIALCAEFMVDGIAALTASGVSQEFTGLILLPIVGNAAEHATAVTVAIKDKMDLAIGVAVGSSMQVALFIIPLIVIIGWAMHMDDMTLSFDIFQVVVMFVAILLVNYLIGDGKSHWLEGMQLMFLYLIIAVCSWWYPTPNSDLNA